MMLSMIVLVFTGYLMGSPWSGPSREADVHVLLRERAPVPLPRGSRVRGLLRRPGLLGDRGQATMRARSSCLRCGAEAGGAHVPAGALLRVHQKESPLWVGHNPLAQLAMFFMSVPRHVVIHPDRPVAVSQQYAWGSVWITCSAGSTCCSAGRRWCDWCTTSRCTTC